MHPVAVEALADELVAGEARRGDDRGRFVAGDRQAALVEPDAVARERLRVAQERDVVDRHDQRCGAGGHRQAGRVADVEAEADAAAGGSGATARSDTVARASACRGTRPPVRGARRAARTRCASRTRTPRARCAAGSSVHSSSVHPTDPAGHRLQQLAHVHADPRGAQPSAVAESHECPPITRTDAGEALEVASRAVFRS